MHGHAQPKRFADAGSLDTGPDAAPEGGIEQNDVHGGSQRIGGKLFEVHYHGIGGQRHAHHLAGAAHAVQAEDGILQVIVAETFNRLSETNGLLGGPGAVGVQAQRVFGESRGDGTVRFQLVIGREDAGLDFVGGKAEALFGGGDKADRLVDGANLAKA